MGYFRSTSNYPERMTLSNPTYTMSMVDHVAIIVEPLKKDSGCPLEKEVTELVYKNPLMVLYLTVN